MSIMCSAVTETKMVTCELEIAPNGKSLYVISLWDGKEWHRETYRSFNAAQKTFRLLSRVIGKRP